MHSTDSVLYSPYGASQMKSTYQRSMLLGNLVVITLVGMALLVAHFVYDPPTIVADGRNGPRETRMDIIPPPTIIRERLGSNRIKRRHPNNTVAGLIKPVEDEEFIEDDPTLHVITDTYDIEDGMDGDDDGFGGAEQGFGGSEGSFDGDALPPDSEFIFAEIMPEAIRMVQPEYPRLAKLAGLEGTVIIKALLDKEGKVIKAIVARSSEIAILDEAALAAAYESIYSPAIQNGRPIRIWITYRVVFELDQ